MSQLMGILLKEWFLSSSMMLLQKLQKTSVHCVQEKTWGGGPFMRHVCALMSSTVHVGVCYGHFVGWVCQEARPGSTAQKGENGIGPKLGKPLHYKGTFFHHIAKGFMAQGGDLLRQAGCAGESIYGDNFPDELPKLKHNEPGLLSMSISDRDLCGSIFILTFRANKDLDRKNVVFGKLAQGYDVLKKIENAGDEEGRPEVTVKIVNCGEYGERDKKKLVKLMARKDAFSEVKHKRSRRRRKRRRKYYTSDSNSSSDSDIDTTDSDSDSDLDSSSTSLVSSSSDDRRRKRKRSSKRDKHKQGKKRDRRRERKRRKHDKRLKRRSRRSSDSITETESESSDGSSDDGAKARGSVLKHKADLKVTAGNYSPLVEDNAAASHHTRGRGAEKLSGKDHRSPKENGKQQSNGFERDARSDRSEDRQPDVVDDHPGKSRSRSRSVSPKRPPSKSMSGSPKRSISQSCSVSPKRPVSRSSSASRSLQSPIIPKSRSISRSPKGSRGSRSPVRRSISRSPAGRSISRSPQRLGPQRSISGSPPKSLPRRSPSRSLPKTSSRRSVGRSPIAASRSPCRRSSHRSISRSSGRVPSRRVASRSPIRSPRRGRRRSYSRSRSPVRRVRSPPSVRRRSLSRSASPDVSPKRVRRGRGFSDRYSYARRYRTPSPSPRPYRYGGRSGRYSSYRRYSPPPRRRISRSPPRYRSRRSPSVSRSPPYHRRRYSPSPVRSLSRSPTRSCSPVDRYRAPCDDKRRSFSSRSRSPTRSPRDSPPPKRGSKDGSISSSSSGSPPAKALVSYGDGSPDSSGR